MGVVFYQGSAHIGPTNASSLSALTTIDEAVLFPIFCGSAPPATGEYNYNEFVEMMTGLYGSSFLSADSFPFGRTAISEYSKTWLPGIGIANGAVFERNLTSLPSGNVWWLVFPTMHRAIRFGSDSFFNPSSIYKINSDDTLTSMSGGFLYDLFTTLQYGYFFTFTHSYGSTPADFKTRANWTGVSYTISFRDSLTAKARLSTVTSRTMSDTALLSLFEDAEDPIVPPEPGPQPTDDPYLPDGVDPSATGGGTGTFTDTGDPIGIPGLPTLSAVDTGLITLFAPTAAQVKSLADYLWSSGFDLSTFKNIVANPMDCILGLTIIPATPTSTASKNLVVGNIDTGLSFPALDTQYLEIDCGTLNVQEFWGSYLDYSPYTKMSLYLPYIGIVPVDIDDVMNASVHVVYHMDVLSGALVAYVQCNGTQLYTYIGQCSSNVPVTSNDFTNTVNGILGIAGNIGSLFATGGASAPTAISGMASNAINALKPNIQKSGAMSGTGGLMGVQIPYLICSRPRQAVPANQNAYTGYPSNITATLSSLSGYTEVEKIHLDGIPCSDEELNEILSLLESGVII